MNSNNLFFINISKIKVLSINRLSVMCIKKNFLKSCSL